MDFFSSNLLIFPVLVPLIASFLCASLNKSNIAWRLGMIATLVSLITSVLLLIPLRHKLNLTYNFGGFLAPIGIEYKIDNLNILILILCSFMAAVCHLYMAKNPISSDDKIPLATSLFLLCVAGLNGMVLSNDIFNIYVFLEISSISSYVLASMGEDKKSLLAGINYLILGTIAATFILLGIGLIYIKTGTLNISDLAIRISPLLSQVTIKAAAVFLLIGLLLKIAIIPVHSWLINVYSHSPLAITSFFVGASSKVNLYLIIKIVITIFGLTTLNYSPLIYLASFTIIIASIAAITQEDKIKTLSFSSIGQMGYLLALIFMWSKTSIIAFVLLAINHSISKTALFMLLGNDKYANYKPFEMALIINLASLIGLPISFGFIGKWYLFTALLEGRNLWLILVIIIATICCGFYSLRLWGEFKKNSQELLPPDRAGSAAIWLLTITNVILALAAGYLIDYASNISTPLEA
jgi:multicomponent Na+:H+ antiporter subunit D